MIGYKNERYLCFGRFAARLDDFANLIPARLTAFLMLLVTGKLSRIKFVLIYAKKHASPNSGYPEAALAGILDCRFGGPDSYFGRIVEKPWLGTNDRTITTNDRIRALHINRCCEWLMLSLTTILLAILIYKFN
jgi:adenosylcobinamide-phosphate synthase